MWKSVIIRPVVASPSCPSDFRPITIVSVLSKGFERLINGQVLAHVYRSGLLSEFQSGFRCGHSTTTALVRIIEDLRSSMLEGRMTVLLTFRRRLIVSSFDFHGLARNMVSTFLNGRSMVPDRPPCLVSPLFFFYVCQLSVRTYSSFEISFLC
jgi:hypothetical protein